MTIEITRESRIITITGTHVETKLAYAWCEQHGYVIMRSGPDEDADGNACEGRFRARAIPQGDEWHD